jgi:hypothetical protein
VEGAHVMVWSVSHVCVERLGIAPLYVATEDEAHALVRCRFCRFFAWRGK